MLIVITNGGWIMGDFNFVLFMIAQYFLSFLLPMDMYYRILVWAPTEADPETRIYKYKENFWKVIPNLVI